MRTTNANVFVAILILSLSTGFAGEDPRDAQAQFDLGSSYAYGQGVQRDYVQAAIWLRKAADQGHPRAQMLLGILYQNGQGVTKDDALAAQWYRKAAAQGNEPARRYLASRSPEAVVAQPPSQAELQRRQDESERNRIWSTAGNLAGTSLQLQEVSRNGDVIVFALRAAGLPRKQRYSLMQWPVTTLAPTVAMKSIAFDADGFAMCVAADGSCGPGESKEVRVKMRLQPVAGEPFRFLVTSLEDANLHVSVSVVPIPNEGRDKGCRLEAVLLTPAAGVVQLDASGFEPNSELEMESNSAGEILRSRTKVAADGSYHSLLVPAVLGKDGGVTRVVLRSGKCAPAVSFGWGTQAGKITQVQK